MKILDSEPKNCFNVEMPNYEDKTIWVVPCYLSSFDPMGGLEAWKSFVNTLWVPNKKSQPNIDGDVIFCRVTQGDICAYIIGLVVLWFKRRHLWAHTLAHTRTLTTILLQILPQLLSNPNLIRFGAARKYRKFTVAIWQGGIGWPFKIT